MSTRLVINGCLTGPQAKNYRRVGTTKSRKISYGPTRNVSQQTSKLVTRKTQRVGYSTNKTFKTVKPPTCTPEDQAVKVVKSSCNSPSCCPEGSCPSTGKC